MGLKDVTREMVIIVLVLFGGLGVWVNLVSLFLFFMAGLLVWVFGGME